MAGYSDRYNEYYGGSGNKAASGEGTQAAGTAAGTRSANGQGSTQNRSVSGTNGTRSGTGTNGTRFRSTSGSTGTRNGSGTGTTRSGSGSGSGGSNNNGKWFKLVAAILALAILVLVIVIIAMPKHKDPDQPRTSGGNTVLNSDEPATPVPVTPGPTNVPAAPVIDILKLEAGTELPAASAFVKPERADTVTQIYYLSSVASIDTSVPGLYEAEIECDGGTYTVYFEITDTVAPTAEVRDVRVVKGTPVAAEDFIVSISDATKVTVSLLDSIDNETGGTRVVRILLKDAAGNETVLAPSLTVVVDTEPPVITVTEYREIYAGDTISYRTGLVVTDNLDEDVKVSIDSSGVDLKTPGTYTVYYTATDNAGNTATASATVVVRDPAELDTPEFMYSEAAMHRKYRELLPKVIDSDMNDIEKLYAIWTYVSEHLTYVSHSDKDSWVRESIRGLNEGTGDCFTFYAIMRALMEEAGFETVTVQRVGGSTQHFWSLVKVGGEWYHIDACPRSESRLRYWYCFLRTDEELLGFGSWEDESVFAKVNYYYQFDTSLVPASATTRIAEAHVNWDTGYIELEIF